mgnify:CR=1 FL=1
MLLNVPFGIVIFHHLGWIYILYVLVLECVLTAKYLNGKYQFDRRISASVIVGNIVSGIVGIIASILATGGWWLVLWIPLVSGNEISAGDPMAWLGLTLYYLIAFIISVALESLVNLGILHGHYTNRMIVRSTIKANVVSYLTGSVAIYFIAFGL